ncbi:hypothetical protein GGS20DRAFT_543835 [Poronia punctata]|nr:hypothetical protein GGS20DRAFT_543835 [Poronia punctata]
MSSFLGAALRLVLNRSPREARTAEQSQSFVSKFYHHRPGPGQEGSEPTTGGVGVGGGGGGNNNNNNNNGYPPTMPGAEAGGTATTVSGQGQGQPYHFDPERDPLTFFRLMLGIQTWPYLGFTVTSPHGTRPAANIGLYARIVHSEQKAKDSFKVFSIVINGCYFLQIVIAAALTALGAAKASSGAVTAFGALNTVIAGFLTFLKGSGLPGRFKYYGNEWKKIREFIEQRERDFMRPGHNLDVYEVVETIEKMYNNLKADIELNTPDSYTSITNQRRSGDRDKDKEIGGFDISKLADKLKGLEEVKGIAKMTDEEVKQIEKLKGDAVRDIQHHKAELDREAEEARAAIVQGKQAARNAVEEKRAQLDRKANEARAAVVQGKQAARDVVEEQRTQLDSASARVDQAVNEHQSRTLRALDDTGRLAQDEIRHTSSHASASLSNLARELSDIHRTAVTDGRTAAAHQIRQLAHRLAGHDSGDDKHDEHHKDGEKNRKNP